ncbi:MAG: type IV pilus modification protein PilV [Marinicella sp.]
MRIFKKKEEGFTLIEVLVAVLIFSFGLLGIAGMMTISVRNNHNGYLRSQANFLAENMMDRMRANPVALWGDLYNGNASPGSDTCPLGTACDYTELAAFDRQQWAQSLAVSLPNGQGNVNCVTNGALSGLIQAATPPSIWFPAPPYNGMCTITVTWTESNRADEADLQTMVLAGQP